MTPRIRLASLFPMLAACGGASVETNTGSEAVSEEPTIPFMMPACPAGEWCVAPAPDASAQTAELWDVIPPELWAGTTLTWGSGPTDVFRGSRLHSPDRSSGGPASDRIERYDGTRWSVLFEVGRLQWIDGFAAGDVWFLSEARLEHYDGTSRETFSWPAGYPPNRVLAIGPRSALLWGRTSLHSYDGELSLLYEEATPVANVRDYPIETSDIFHAYIRSVAARAADDIWILRTAGRGRSTCQPCFEELLHYDGTSWSYDAALTERLNADGLLRLIARGSEAWAVTRRALVRLGTDEPPIPIEPSDSTAELMAWVTPRWFWIRRGPEYRVRARSAP